MSYVLVMVTVLYSSTGVASDTTFQEFASESACETARDGVERGLIKMKGTIGREIFAACYPTG